MDNKYKSLDLNKLKSKKSTIISSEEALKDIIPIDWSINEDTNVYCTNCIHFRLCDKGIPYCYHEETCNIKNCEDSMPFRERPNYEPKTN